MATLVLTGLAFAVTSATPRWRVRTSAPQGVQVRDHHHVKRVCRWVRSRGRCGGPALSPYA
jgi:hypothetical protein